MTIYKKLIVLASVLVNVLAVSALLLGAPDAVSTGMLEGYRYWTLGFGYLSLLSLAGALWFCFRPGSLWGLCVGVCLPLGAFLLGAANYALFTGWHLPAVFGIAGFLMLFAGLIFFLAAAAFAKN